MTGCINSQTIPGFERKVYNDGNGSMPYRILLPKDFNASKKYPVIFFLHGMGERGNDNDIQLVHGSSLFLSDSVRNKYPSIVVFPQCPKDSYWSNVFTEEGLRSFNITRSPTKAMEMLILLINKVLTEYPVEKKQVYIGGLSMGGMGVFEIAARQPGLFAAAFAICGGGDTTAVDKMINPAWWIFHGKNDEVVPPVLSEQMAEALTKAGANVKLSMYPNVNHDSWNNAFAEPNLLPWLFSHHK